MRVNQATLGLMGEFDHYMGGMNIKALPGRGVVAEIVYTLPEKIGLGGTSIWIVNQEMGSE